MYLPQPKVHLHMPFAFRKDGQLQAVYCQCNAQFRYRGGSIVGARPTAWKLQWMLPESGATRSLPTGLAENEEECSPTVSDFRGGVQVSFIGRVAGAKPSGKTLFGVAHRLFVMRGPDIHHLGPAAMFSDEQASCGFVRPDLAILANGADGIARIIGGRARTLATSFEQLHRISYCFDRPDRILITGSLGSRRAPQTIVFDVDDGKTGRVLGELQADGRPCYKPSLLADVAIVPIATSRGQERRLWSTASFLIVGTAIGAALS